MEAVRIWGSLVFVVLLFALTIWVEHFDSDLWPPED